MKLNTKTRYGIRAMIELAMDWGGKGMFQKEISERQEISYKYLDHIISALKTKGLISNVDGKKSGYRLAKKPEEISVYDIYKAFEPALQIVDCIGEHGECVRAKNCAASDLWCGLNNKIIEHLDSINLSELAKKQQALNQRDEKADMYYI
ncbi:MAG TPA: Rrf2 family transcriptional regulator [Bacteroidales bacterium]|jgi:Rrf2 family protein|nr:Rrf2 family transcriptional regulator [Bacteroidales bacterium]